MFTYVLMFIRWALALVAGFYLVYKTRHLWQGPVMRLIPMKYRISEKGYIVTNRIMGVMRIVFALLAGFGLSQALLVLTEAVHLENRANTQTVLPPVIPGPDYLPEPEVFEPEPMPVRTPAPIYEDVDSSIVSPELPAPSPIPPKPVPPNRSKPSTPQPIPYQPRPVSPNYQERQVPHFVQLYAFKELDKAQRAQGKWSQQLQTPCWIGIVDKDKTPYKLLVGPFRNRSDAEQYRLGSGLKGFSRKGEEVRLLGSW